MPDQSAPLRIHSFIEEVAIDDVLRDMERLREECFSAVEREALASKRTQTWAGFLALKRALAALAAHREPGSTFEERDFLLTHNEKGAPSLVSSPAKACPSLFLSISHTRKTAYGLAVYGE